MVSITVLQQWRPKGQFVLYNMEQSSSCRKQCHAKVIRDISVFSMAFLLKQTLVNNSRMKVDKLRLVNYILQVKLS